MYVSLKRNQINTQPHFKSVNYVMIAKNAFERPDDVKLVEATFKNIIEKVAPPQSKGIKGLLNLIFSGSSALDYMYYLEKPGYSNVVSKLQDAKEPYILNEFKQNTNSPRHSNGHSFVILTQEQKDRMVESFSPLNIIRMAKDSAKRQIEILKVLSGVHQPTTEQMKLARNVASSEQTARSFDMVIAGEPVNKFVVNDLSELPEVLRKIDF